MVTITQSGPGTTSVSITYSLPHTGFASPSAAEAAKLARIVDAAHPWIGLIENSDPEEFQRAFTAAGFMFRTADPVSKYAFTHFLDEGNVMLRERMCASSVGAPAFLGAVLAHGDVCWRKPDPSLGQLLELGLDIHRGQRCSNAWRGILTGERNLLSPMPARQAFIDRSTRGVPVATIWSQGQNSMRQIERGDPLWSKV
jgi:hypothetical protein